MQCNARHTNIKNERFYWMISNICKLYGDIHLPYGQLFIFKILITVIRNDCYPQRSPNCWTVFALPRYSYIALLYLCIKLQVEEYFRQPVVDTFDIRILMSKSIKYTVNFMTANEEDLHRIEIPLQFTAHSSGTVHGLAFWFDIAFIGTM